MGTTFVAIADGPSAIAYNPAGLASLKGTNVYLGVTPLVISTTYESPSGESEDAEFHVFYPPHLYLSSSIGKGNMAFGLGLFSPFGIGGRAWDEDGLTRYGATRSEIATLSINPAFSWQAFPAISMGAGINYMKAITRAGRIGLAYRSGVKVDIEGTAQLTKEVKRVTTQTAQLRNQMMIELADKIVTGFVNKGGMLESQINDDVNKNIVRVYSM